MSNRYLEHLLSKYDFQEIKFIMADKNYSVIEFENNTSFKICNHVGCFEKYLQSNMKFTRIHYSYIVNMDFISNIDFQACILKLNSGEHFLPQYTIPKDKSLNT